MDRVASQADDPDGPAGLLRCPTGAASVRCTDPLGLVLPPPPAEQIRDPVRGLRREGGASSAELAKRGARLRDGLTDRRPRLSCAVFIPGAISVVLGACRARDRRGGGLALRRAPATVMQRKRTTIQDYRGYLRRHLEPYFGDRPSTASTPDHVDRLPAGQASRGSRPRRSRTTSTSSTGSSPSRQARLGDREPGRARRPPRGSRRQSRRLRFLQPEEVERRHPRGARRRARRRRAAALPVRRDDRPAPGRAASARAGSTSTGRPAGARGRQLHARHVAATAEVATEAALGPDGRPPGRRARAPLPALPLPATTTTSSSPTRDGARPRRLEAAQALPRP